MVMFPNVVIPITAGRKTSIQLLEEAQKNGDFIGIVSQKIQIWNNLPKKTFIQPVL
jgi:ATP-dependent Lon protease